MTSPLTLARKWLDSLIDKLRQIRFASNEKIAYPQITLLYVLNGYSIYVDVKSYLLTTLKEFAKL